MYQTKMLFKCNPVIPVNDMKKCSFKICDKSEWPLVPQENKCKTIHSATADSNWNHFLKTQQESTANYLYKFQIYGKGEDPTIEEDKRFPEQLIHQRLNHMPDIGNLEQQDLYCLLFVLLNLKNLNATKQSQLMQHLLKQRILDKEILLYLTILTRHPNTNLSQEEKKAFLALFTELMTSQEFRSSGAYFNANHIFRKDVNTIDPYEKEYLKSIMDTESSLLNQDQYLYLLNFVTRLQEIPSEEREKYLKALYNENVLPFVTLNSIKLFLKTKSPKVNHEKMRNLLLESGKLMNICLITMPNASEVENLAPSKSKLLQVDKKRIKNALQSLMKADIPNIVRVNEFEDYLNEILQLDELKQQQFLEALKNSENLTKAEVLFIYKFVVNQKLIKKPEKFKEIITKVASTPADPSKLSVIFGSMPVCALAKDYVEPASITSDKDKKGSSKKEVPVNEIPINAKDEDRTRVQEEKNKNEETPKKEQLSKKEETSKIEQKLKKEEMSKHQGTSKKEEKKENIETEEKPKKEEEKPKIREKPVKEDNPKVEEEKSQKDKKQEKTKKEEKTKKKETTKNEEKPQIEEIPKAEEKPKKDEKQRKEESPQNNETSYMQDKLPIEDKAKKDDKPKKQGMFIPESSLERQGKPRIGEKPKTDEKPKTNEGHKLDENPKGGDKLNKVDHESYSKRRSETRESTVPVANKKRRSTKRGSSVKPKIEKAAKSKELESYYDSIEAAEAAAICCRIQEASKHGDANNFFLLCTCGNVYEDCEAQSPCNISYREKLYKLKKYYS